MRNTFKRPFPTLKQMHRKLRNKTPNPQKFHCMRIIRTFLQHNFSVHLFLSQVFFLGRYTASWRRNCVSSSYFHRKQTSPNSWEKSGRFLYTLGMEHVHNEIFKTVTAKFCPKHLKFLVDLNLYFFPRAAKVSALKQTLPFQRTEAPKAVSGGASLLCLVHCF